KAAGAQVVCHAKATQKGIAVDPACLVKADTKLAGAFAKAEEKGGCASIGDAGTIDALVDSSVGAFVAALRPVADANRCAAAKLKATGKKAKTKIGCHAKATARGVTVDAACLAMAEARFVAAFAKAESRPPCLTSGDAASVESLVDTLFADAVAALPSPPTTTTTAPPVCGDGVRNQPQEQCDGPDSANCSGLCQPDCTCPPPVCGNGVLEGSEACEEGILGFCEMAFFGGCEGCQCCVSDVDATCVAPSFQFPCCGPLICATPPNFPPPL